MKLNNENMQDIVKLVYDTIQWNQKKIDDYNLPSKLKFDYLFVTIIKNGKILACQAGKEADNLFEYIIQATKQCLNDKRFDFDTQKEDVSVLKVCINILYNKKSFYNLKIDDLKKTITPGINAVQIQKWNKKALFKESVQISKNYSTKNLLQKLSLKAWIGKNGYLSKNSKISIFDTFSFIWYYNLSVNELYRHNILVNVGDIDLNNIKSRLSLAKNWFQNNINPPTWLLEYMYYPSKWKYEESNNQIRQLASVWAVTELDNFFETKDFEMLSKNTINFYLKYIKDEGDYAYLKIHKNSIANSAFFIMILLNCYEYSFWQKSKIDNIIEKLADGILIMQRNDGSYYTKFHTQEISWIDFFPWESMLALMKLYEHTWNTKYLNSVLKAFPYYKNYWQKNKTTAFIPWQTQALYLLNKYKPSTEIQDFIFEMNDWIIDTYQVFDSQHKDFIWWFRKPNPTIWTTSYMEGILDAYDLANNINDEYHRVKYMNTIIQATRFIFQLQYTYQNSFYIQNLEPVVWWFRQSLTNNQLRNDNTQHASFALMKIYKSWIFS